MRPLAPRPLLLALTLALVVGAITLMELRLDASGGNSADLQPNAEPVHRLSKDGLRSAENAKTERNSSSSSQRTVDKKPKTISDAERIARKDDQYTRAKEITGSTGLINTDGVSIKDAAGEKVVLVEFWTYSCVNCQRVQPHMNAFYSKYKDDGLLVVGVHTPEFGFEKEYANVRQAVHEANIEYPVVLDSRYAIWNAYGQRFWPAWYLIDTDGFIRYKHFGEGAYGETEQKVRDLLAERDRNYD